MTRVLLIWLLFIRITVAAILFKLVYEGKLYIWRDGEMPPILIQQKSCKSNSPELKK